MEIERLKLNKSTLKKVCLNYFLNEFRNVYVE